MEENPPTVPLWALVLGIAGVVVGAALRLYWVFLLPYNDAPDEYCHYPMVLLMRSEQRLPTMADVPDRVPASYPALPPFGYLPCVVTAFALDPSHPEAFRAARLGNVVVGTLTLAAGFAATLLYFPGWPQIAVATVWVMALHPQLAFLNAYVNNDSSMVLACTLVWLTWGWIGRRGFSPGQALLLGLLCGVALLTKTNSLSTILAGAPVLALQLYQGRFKECCLAGVTAAAVCAPWLLWSHWHHGSWTGVEVHRQWWFDHLAAQGIQQGFLNTENFGDFAVNSWNSFWASFGYCSTLLADWQYYLITLVAGIGLAMVVSKGDRLAFAADTAGTLSQTAMLLTIPIGIALAVAAHIWHSLQFGLAPQGRYVMGAEWAVAAALAAGFALLWSGRISRHMGTIALVAFFAWLHWSAVEVEKTSNRYWQPDRRARCRLLAYAGSVPGVPGNCQPKQWHADQSSLNWEQNIARWRGEPAEGGHILTADLLDVPQRYVVLWMRAISGFGNEFRLRAVRSGAQPVEIPFHPMSLGLCEYRFDLRQLVGEGPVRLEFFAQGTQPIDLEIHQMQLQ